VLLPAYDALVAQDDDVWIGRVGDFSAVTRPSQGSFHTEAQCAPCEILKHQPIGNCPGSPTTERRVMSERLGRTLVLPVLLVELTLEPVLVLLAVGHVGPFEGHGLLL
jgi:hypothetical protein